MNLIYVCKFILYKEFDICVCLFENAFQEKVFDICVCLYVYMYMYVWNMYMSIWYVWNVYMSIWYFVYVYLYM